MAYGEGSPIEGQERRAATRYDVALRLELWPEAKRRSFDSDFFPTKNLSLQGFYFISARDFELGSRLNFAVIFPPNLTGHKLDLILGVVEIVRRELILAEERELLGFAARIEHLRNVHGKTAS